MDVTKIQADKHKKWYMVAAGASLTILLVLAIVVHGYTLTGIELSAFRTINDLPSSWHTPVEWISEVGLFVGAFIAVCLIALRRFKLAWHLVAGMGSAYVASKVVKELVDRPRPEGMLESLHIRMIESGAGFPSAHVTIITTVMVILFPYLPHKWRWLIAPLAIALVAASRVYLGVHSPLDVIGGIALGVLVAATIRILPVALKKLLRLD